MLGGGACAGLHAPDVQSPDLGVAQGGTGSRLGPAAAEAAQRLVTLPRALTNPVTLPDKAAPPAVPEPEPKRPGYGPGEKCCLYHILDGTRPACGSDIP